MIKARLLGRRTTGFLSVSPKSGSPLQGITNQKLNFRTFVQDRILFCLFWEVGQFCSTGMHGAFHSSVRRWALKATEVYDVPHHLALLRSEGLAQHLPTGSSSPAAAAATVHFCLARLLVAPRGVPQPIQIQKYGLANLNISCHAFEIDVLFLWGGLEAFYISGTWINISSCRFVVAQCAHICRLWSDGHIWPYGHRTICKKIWASEVSLERAIKM